ncbi:MAG: hypothetical protein JWP81_1339 [Ferruginibacter sp.]|nr:hypothetical protein [Ferruginibacter sp.]
MISQHGIADVLLNITTNHYGLFSATVFERDNIISNFSSATTQERPSYLTVQTGVDKHITLEPAFLQYINHSCDPNVFFDTTSMKLICLKFIQPGDELCFFYPSTEWQMDRPFICNCGSNQCLQLIEGAANINAAILYNYRLSDFIVQQLQQRT